LTELGRINPVFEKAGFRRVENRHSARRSATYPSIYGGRRSHGLKNPVTQETSQKSRHADPAYFIFDNHAAVQESVTNNAKVRNAAG